MSGFGLYWPGGSALHRMDPRGKLLAFVAASVAIFFIPSAIPLLIFFLALVGIGKISRLPTASLFAGLGAMLLILIFGIAMRGAIVLMFLRVLSLLVAANLFVLTTSPFQLGQALRKIFGGPLGFTVTLVFRFFPLLDEERIKISRAQILRGAALDSPNPLARIQAYPALLVPLFVLTFQKADRLATAMLLRSCSPSFSGTPLRAIRWRGSDTLLLTAFFALLAALYILSRRLVWP